MESAKVEVKLFSKVQLESNVASIKNMQEEIIALFCNNHNNTGMSNRYNPYRVHYDLWNRQQRTMETARRAWTIPTELLPSSSRHYLSQNDTPQAKYSTNRNNPVITQLCTSISKYVNVENELCDCDEDLLVVNSIRLRQSFLTVIDSVRQVNRTMRLLELNQKCDDLISIMENHYRYTYSHVFLDQLSETYTLSTDIDESCVVCQSVCLKGATIRTLNCGHYFHISCIDKWLYSSALCPMCRGPVRELANFLSLSSIEEQQVEGSAASDELINDTASSDDLTLSDYIIDISSSDPSVIEASYSISSPSTSIELIDETDPLDNEPGPSNFDAADDNSMDLFL